MWTKEQLMAIEKSGSNIIVSASAGSGKTAVLSERVKNNLSKGYLISEMLILTFTKASANEMKERIKKNIIDDQINSSLLESAYITTIDSFCLSILKRFHYLINLSKEIKVTDDLVLKNYRRKFLREVFEEMYLEENENFIEILKEFTNKSDQEFFDKILRLDDSFSTITNKLVYFKTEFELDLKLAYQDYLDILSKRLNKLIEMLELVPDDCSSKHQDFIKNYLDALKGLKDDDLIVLKNQLAFFGEIPRASKECLEDYRSAVQKIKDFIKKEFLPMILVTDYSAFEKEFLIIKKNGDFIKEILYKFNKKFADFKTKEEKYGFNDILELAIKLLREHDIARNELKNSFKEIILDEYQDTSDLQETLINLIANDNVYQVGDLKQSIYRFRGANSYLFKNKYSQYSNNIGGIKIDLNKNFRSRKEVIETVNDFFSKIMTDEVGDANYQEEHKMEYGLSSYDNFDLKRNNKTSLLYYPTIMESEEKIDRDIHEFYYVALDILNKYNQKVLVYDKEIKGLRKCRLSDFAVLSDKTTKFDTLKKVFEFVGLKVALSKDESIRTGLFLKVLNSILSLLTAFKNDDKNLVKYYLASILRSYLYNYSDEEIYQVISGDYYQNEVYQKFYQLYLKLDGLTNLMLLEILMNEFEIVAKSTSLHLIVDEIAKYKYLEEIAKGTSSIEEFLELISMINRGDVDALFEKIDGEKDAVLITSIHKSKGLEYPICYVIGMNNSFFGNKFKSSNLFTYRNQILFNLNDERSVFNYLVDSVEEKELISEKIRLLYVAFTRAREELVLVDSLDDLGGKKQLTYSGYLSPYYNDYLSNRHTINNVKVTDGYMFLKTPDFKIDNDEKIDVFEDLIIEKKPVKTVYSKEKYDVVITEESQKFMEYGNLVHEVFEYIDFSNQQEFLTSLDEPFKSYVDNFLNKLNELNLKSPIFLKEYAFIDETGKNGIIDLLVETEDSFIIIDYKLKEINLDAYIKQLKAYQKYLSSKTNKKILTYLYSILDSVLKEV